MILTILFSTLAPSIVGAATFYVGTGGSDRADCSREKPCRTITFAVDKLSPGDELIVLSGSYRERVRITKSGTAASPVTISANGDVETDGFRLEGDWIVVKGFKVDHGCLETALSPAACRYSGTASQPDVYGFWITGNDTVVRDNFITGTHWGGVYSAGARNRIENNRIIRTGHPGITIFGSRAVVENNEIADVMPYSYGPNNQWFQDQDGVRLFGSGHTVRRNYIHDIYLRRAGPHSDAMQTFDTNGSQYALTDTTIEENTILNTGTAGMFESRLGVAHDIVWKNNVFMNGIGHMIQVQAKDFRFEGNIFYITRYAGIISTAGPGTVQRNTFLWVYGTRSGVGLGPGEGNWAYPSPQLLADPIRTEDRGTVGVPPPFRNIPSAVFRTVSDGSSSSLYLTLADAARLPVGATIEIDADGFARTIEAIDHASGRVNFTPSISGAMSRVPGSRLPNDYGQWTIVAANRPVAVWPTADVIPSFVPVTEVLPPSGVRAAIR